VTSKFVQNYSGPWLISDNFAINLWTVWYARQDKR
jgi:hypothetical protein